MMADRRQSSRHLDEKDDQDRPEHDGPDQPQAKVRPRLRRRRNGSHFKKAPHARDDSQRDLKDLAAFHPWPMIVSIRQRINEESRQPRAPFFGAAHFKPAKYFGRYAKQARPSVVRRRRTRAEQI